MFCANRMRWWSASCLIVLYLFILYLRTSPPHLNVPSPDLTRSALPSRLISIVNRTPQLYLPLLVHSAAGGRRGSGEAVRPGPCNVRLLCGPCNMYGHKHAVLVPILQGPDTSASVASRPQSDRRPHASMLGTTRPRV
ncbi:hypothetical protein BDQ17DRAFT_1358647 [Cyathus striatus]|nr:hypothetical protein BDQ17DRAFT_1358647 [Cyathus striatus]